MAHIATHFDRMALPALARWAQSMSQLAKPTKAQQDGVDALICLLTLVRWWESGLDRSMVVGDLSTGYMVVPVDDDLRDELARDAR